MVKTKMVARHYCRSQMQRYPRARFAAPKEYARRITIIEITESKFKKTTTQFENVHVKNNRRVVRKMTVRLKSIFPESKRRREY